MFALSALGMTYGSALQLGQGAAAGNTADSAQLRQAARADYDLGFAYQVGLGVPENPPRSPLLGIVAPREQALPARKIP